MVTALLTLLTGLATALSLAPFLRPKGLSTRALLWPVKVVAGSLVTILGTLCGLGAALGLVRRDRRLAAIGILGAGLAVRFLRDLPDPQGEFAAAFGADWERRLPPSIHQPPRRARHWAAPASPASPIVWQRDIACARNPKTGATVLADLWQPAAGAVRSGLAAIYLHGGAWGIGAKDMGTRPFFRHLAGQGHVILDVAYTLWPQADIPAMVSEVQQGVVWLKEHAAPCGLDPDRIVLMGGSAGAHLALLTAFSAGHPSFAPTIAGGDPAVCGVVAFYPPVDLLAWQAEQDLRYPQQPERPAGRAVEAMLLRFLGPKLDDLQTDLRLRDWTAAVLGGPADQIPETWRLLSPSTHVGPHCPPTLLLQGCDDTVLLAPFVRRLHRALRRAGVPVVLIEFPHAEHGFDLALPQLSPLAWAATRNVERFLALLAKT